MEKGIFNNFLKIPKFLILDRDIGRTAKFLYIVIANFTHMRDGEAYPSIKTIQSAFGGCDECRIYRAIDELKREGYITVSRRYSAKSDVGYQHNVYTLEKFPSKFTRAMSEQNNVQYQNGVGLRSNRAEFEKVKTARDIFVNFGKLPKTVYNNTTLHFVSKLMYAVNCVFSDYKDKRSYLRRADIMGYLGIRANGTYDNYRRPLVKINLLRSEQLHVDGRFNRNNYYLVAKPNIADVTVGKIVKVITTATEKVVTKVKKVAKSITKKAIRKSSKKTVAITYH